MIVYGAYGNLAFIVTLILTTSSAALVYKEDIDKIQASNTCSNKGRILLEQSTTGLTAASTELTTTHLKPFSLVPTLVYGICNMKIANSIEIQYQLRAAYVSQTDFTLELTVGSSIVYRMYVNAMALDFYGLSSVVTTHVPINCLNKLTNVKCTEMFMTPFPNSDYLMLSVLIGVNLKNDLQSATVDKSYQLNISRTYVTNVTDSQSYFSVTTGFTVNVLNFSICWMAIGRVHSNSDNITLLVFGREMSRNGMMSFGNVYSTGYTISNQSMLVGKLGFSFDPGNSIDFDLYYQNSNALRSQILNETALSVAVNVFAACLLVGAPACQVGTLVMYPQAVCVLCDVLRCATCSFTLCATCMVNRYLNVLNDTTGGGECLCLDGYTQVNSSCVVCDPKCKKCSGSPSVCTQCHYGYFLFGTQCAKYCFVTNVQLAMVLDCQVCPQGCTICQTSTNCSIRTCNNYYYDDMCYDTCPDGTYGTTINNVNICMSCSTLCRRCVQPIKCTSCVDGYYMSNNQCIMCQSPCMTCEQPGTETCLSCVDGYTLAGESCQPIQVTICQQGYYQLLDQCLPCPVNCLVCDQNHCYQCQQEYLLDGGTCQKCNILGYHLVNKQCVEICGDGIRINQQCDDNNTVSHDGCSDECYVQPGYLCQPSEHGDTCYSMKSTITVLLRKSLIRNRVEVKILFSQFNIQNIAGWSIECQHSGYRVTDIHITQNVEAIILYTEHMVDVWCHVQVTHHKQLSFQVTTQPPAIYELERSIIGWILMAMAALCLLIMLPAQLVVPQLTVSFINHSLLLVPQLFLKMHMPIVFYQSKYAMSLLSMDWLNINGNEFILSWQEQICFNSIFVLSYIIIAFLLVITTHKKMKQTAFRPCYRVIRQCHNIYSSYQPILIVNLCLTFNRQMNALNIATISIISVLAATDIVYTLWRSWNIKIFLVANDGPIQKVRCYTYCFIVMLVDRHYFRLGTIMGIGLGLAVLGMKVYQLLRHGSGCPTTLSTKHLKYLQRYLNEISFVVYNLVAVRLSIAYQNSQVYGYCLLANLGIFLLLNAVLVVWGIILRVRENRQTSIEATEREDKQQIVSTIMSNTTANLRYKDSKTDKVNGSLQVIQHSYDDVIIEGLSEIDLEDRMEERKKEQEDRSVHRQNIEDSSQFQSLVRNEDDMQQSVQRVGQSVQLVGQSGVNEPQPRVADEPPDFIVREVQSVLQDDEGEDEGQQVSQVLNQY